MPKKPTKRIKTEDRDLFRQTVGTVRPVVSDRLHLPPHKKPKPIPKPRQIEFDGPSREGTDAIAEVGVSEPLSYIAPGIQKMILKKMRRGAFDIEAELDLHGFFERDARRQLLRLIHFCVLDGLHCVHIIHGKGYRSLQGNPVLKNRVNLWLRQHEDVLAFCSANPADGGTGAIYVLLRTSKDKMRSTWPNNK